MKESELKGFFDGDVDAIWLELSLENVAVATSLDSDLPDPVRLTASEMVRLCDAHLDGGLSCEGLQAVAGLILESDNFAWDEDTEEGELVAEVLWGWAMPDDEAPPTTEIVADCRRKLVAS